MSGGNRGLWALRPKAVSKANALGLMQVLPGTAKMVAKKNGVAFDQKRLLSDPVYNVQIGAAELGSQLERYRGSYILTFAAYNAGPGRVREWIGRYGDPRDPQIDPIDWVERIPFQETRIYVQRILENMQVYRIRFGGPRGLMIEADLRRGSISQLGRRPRPLKRHFNCFNRALIASTGFRPLSCRA